MSDKITFTLHELVSELDNAADSLLTRRYGITASQFVFIATLVDYEPADVTTLARCLRVSKAAVSKRTPGLVKAGLITLSEDPNHGRRVLVSATERAHELVESAGHELETQFAHLLQHPDARDIDPDVLNRQLTTLIRLLKENGPLT